MKYIHMQGREGKRYFMTFSEDFIHLDMARIAQKLLRRTNGDNVKLVSAGFIQPGTNFHMHGRSESLDVDSKPEMDEAYYGLDGQANALPLEMVQPIWEKAKDRKNAR